jgi:shikimate dehydrogenase
MKKYIVIGNPIEHSLSPKLHSYWFKKYGIEAIYEKVQVLDTELEQVISKIKKGEINGANVTVPYKSKLIKYLDALSEDAEKTQSVNTIYKREGKIYGANTDTIGFEQSLLEKHSYIENKKVLILGAGGVTPSIICVLQKLKVNKILISNRTKDNAEKLKEKFTDIDVVNWGETPSADFIINTTSVGLHSNDHINIDYDKIGTNKFYYDVIYKPSKTSFLREAEKRGNKIENGKLMFIYQAQKAFEIWHSTKPEVNSEVEELLDD